MKIALTTTKALQFYQVLRQGAGILTGVLLAKTGLSTGEIGVFEMLLYIGTTLSFFWVNGLLQGIIPMHQQFEEKDQKPFLFNVFLIFLGIAAAIWAFLYFGQNFAVPWITGLNSIPHYFLFITYLLFNLPSFPVEIFYLLKNDAKSIVWWGIVSFGLHLAILCVPLFMGWGLAAAFKALIAFAFLRMLWTAFLALTYGQASLRIDLIKTYLFFASPLVANAVLGHLVPLFDTWLVGQWFQDERTFAIYRYGSREFPIALALATALGTSAVVPLSLAWKHGTLRNVLPDLKSKTTKLLHIVFPLSILTMLFSKNLFPIVFNPDFAESAPLFNIYLFLVISRVLLPGTIVLASGKSRIVFWVGLAELAIKIILGFIFIEKWGLAGLGFSAVLAYFFEKAALTFYLWYKQGIRPDEWLDFRWYFLYISLLCMAYYVA